MFTVVGPRVDLMEKTVMHYSRTKLPHSQRSGSAMIMGVSTLAFLFHLPRRTLHTFWWGWFVGDRESGKMKLWLEVRGPFSEDSRIAYGMNQLQ